MPNRLRSRLPTLTPPRRWLLLAALIAVAASWGAAVIATRREDAALRREAGVAANLFEAVLRNVLERYRALPLVLAGDAAVEAALRDPAVRPRLNRRLAALAARTGAAAIYVIAADGRTIAASNAGTPLSFVGREFTYRDYFAKAMAQGRGEQFALGTTTNQPGLYLSARVDAGGRALGVVVTKIDFSAVERQWRQSPTPVFVSDGNGIVIITSVEAWRFRPERALALRPNSSHPAHVDARLPGGGEGEYVRAQRGTGMAGWTLNLLQPAGPAVAAAATAASTLTLIVAGLMIAAGWWINRRRTRDARAAAARAAAQAQLEAMVADRTRELTAEMDERRRAEAALLQLHLELEQANRLTTLGQIAAGVTHEINQPVAAIATWAHSARHYLARGQAEQAGTALATIQQLTTRIGHITGELRDFARKSDGPPVPVVLADAIAGSRLLVPDGQGRRRIEIDSRAVPAGLAVLADRIRLEQVLVNLLRNAQEAGASRIRLSAVAHAGQIRIDVADNGPGLPPDIAASLFTPFQTSKPRGLGLGLIISRDICRAMGGDLALAPSPIGTCFRITLPDAA
jgi:two-component system C4-dicarboxylate transport sensor histidine kinase DctB